LGKLNIFLNKILEFFGPNHQISIPPLNLPFKTPLFRMSGIYLELVFLDGFLNLGQSLFTLAIFGINTKVIKSYEKWMINKFGLICKDG